MDHVASQVRNWVENGLKHALIDVDNTLVKANITELYFALKRNRIQRRWHWFLWCVYFAVAWAPLYIVLDAWNREWFQRAFYKRYHEFSIEQIEAEAERLFQQKCQHSLISHTDQLIQCLLQHQVSITLLSTNIEPMVKRFASRYGIEYACLRVDRHGPCAQVNLENLRDFKYRCAVSYPSSSLLAVADSKHDLPVLQQATFAVVISNRRSPWMRRIGGPYTLLPRECLRRSTS